MSYELADAVSDALAATTEGTDWAEAPEPLDEPGSPYVLRLTNELAARGVEHGTAAMEVVDAVIAMVIRGKMSSSTLPPGVLGMGGQAMTGWYPAEQAERVVEVLEQHFRDRLRAALDARRNEETP